MTLAASFFRLFAGLARSHGRYVVPPGAKPNPKGKLHDTKWARTVHEPLSVALWEEHLRGIFGLGVVPIRDDSTCVFGAMDVDVYPLDLKALAGLVKRLELPLIICRTKSGGAHLFLFLSSPAKAELVRGRLMEWSIVMGYAGIEIFPKQTRLAGEKDDGSWINAPYNGGARSTRYAIRADGSAMTPEEFVAAAEESAVTPAELAAWELPPDEEYGDVFEEAPPCLVTLARKGFGDWQNNGLFNVAVYLKKRFGVGWETRLGEYNKRFMDPPVDMAEVKNIVKSVNKKTYSYMCKQEPICGVCNRQVCLTREWGVGGLSDDPGVVFGEMLIIETEPVIFIWDVNGARLELTIDEITDQRKFHKVVIAKIQKWPTLIKSTVWHAIVEERLDRATIVKVPDDATKEGQFWVHVERFCTSKVRGRSLDELLLGKPYTEGDRVFFCSVDLFQYFNQHRFAVTEKDAYRWMRERGVVHHRTRLKGKQLSYWSIPAFPEQTEEHEVPRLPPPDRM